MIRSLGHIAGLASLLLGCAAGPVRSEDLPRSTRAGDGPPAAPAVAQPVPTSSSTAGPSTAPIAANRRRNSAFPPTNIAPPFERTKKAKDGLWSTLAVGSDSQPTVVTTVIHPHKIRGDVEAQLVAIDTFRVRLGFVLGTEEPEGEAATKELRTGMIPPSDVPVLIAAMNGGFKRRHGQHGASVSGIEVVAARPEACSLVSQGGKIRIGTHQALGLNKDAPLDFLRQGPPCLVEAGAKHPDTVNEYKAKKWGGAEDGKKEVRRSAFAISADQETLYFAIGDWVTADWFADALVFAHVDAACQFDINWSFTRFVLYQHSAQGEPIASSPLLSKLKFSATEYWKTPSFRDFFYLAHK